MSLVEQYFKNVDESERFAYLQEGCFRETDIPQSYEKLTEVITQLENVAQDSLSLKKGILYEDTPLYVTAEIRSNERDLSYVYFNATAMETAMPISVLAKISERDLDASDAILFPENCDSRENTLLRNNQVVIGGRLIESEYIALCINGVWYEYRDRAKGECLIASTINIQEDLVPINN